MESVGARGNTWHSTARVRSGVGKNEWCLGTWQEVLDLTPENFEDVVGQDKPALVEFFAPWCGHCKSLAPEYEKVGETYSSSDNVVIAKVDADAHKDLGSEYGVSGFPTLKWFPAGSLSPEDYEGGRTAEDLCSFVNDKTGLKKRVKRPPSHVATLTSSSFDAVAMDPNKDVLVEFFAPWCGHCKALAPTYEDVAKTFAAEPDVVVAAVDATAERDLASRFEVSGFPTIKFFPRGDDKEPVDYERGRSGNEFVSFLNEKAGTQRKLGGDLDKSAGRSDEMDELAMLFVSSSQEDREEVLERARDAAKTAADTAKHYVKAMEKILAKGNDYVKNELDRLHGMINSESVPEARKTLFRLRRNILRAFKE